MKSIVFAILLICLPHLSVNGQHAASWGIYGSAQITQSSYTGIKGSLDYHWRQKHSVGISLAWIERKADNVPDDYYRYRAGNSEPVPNDYYIWTLSYGHYVPLIHNEKLRLHIQAGFSVGEYKTAENYRLNYVPPNTGYWIIGWKYDDVTMTLYGITINPAIEYVPARGFGITAGMLACINNQRFCVAAEGGVLFGVMHNRKKRIDRN